MGCATCGGTNIFLYPLQGGELYITDGHFDQALDSEGESYLIVEHGGAYANSVIDYSKTKVEISGGTFVGMNPAEIKKFNQTVDNKLDMTTEPQTNGCAEGYEPKDNGDGTYGIVKENIAKIGDVLYNDLAIAVEEVKSGETITLTKDVKIGTGIKVASGKNFTLDLGGYTYTIASNPVGSKGTETLGFQLLKDSNITIKNGTITSETGSGVKLLVMNYANLTLDGVELDGANLDDVANAGGYVMSNNNGTTVIKDSTITAPTDGVAFDVDYQASYPDGAKVSLEGNTTINGAIVYEENAQNSLVKDTTVTADAPEGYKWVKVGAKYSLQVAADYKFVVDPAEAEIVEGANETFTVDIKIASEKVDTFYSAEYIVKYDATLLTCAEDNNTNDFDETVGIISLEVLNQNGKVGESIGTLTFTAKDFDLTKETEIEVTGSVLATKFDSITGNSVEAGKGTGVVVMKETLEVTVGEGLVGANVAYNGTDYVISIAKENQGKQNTVKYTINGVENVVVLPVGTNEYTIDGDKILGDMEFEITDTFTVTVIGPYVEGYALVLVEGTADDGYTYDGHQMFKIEREAPANALEDVKYNGRYGWLVDGRTISGTKEEVLATIKEDAYKAITVGGASKSVETTCDVNSCFVNDGKINFQDVTAAYACQRVDFALTEADMYYFMELYLASDVNCDGRVDVLDTAMISNSYK